MKMSRLKSSAFMIAFVLVVVIACAAGQTSAAASPTAAARLYATQCAGCHGTDARGTDHAPPLAGNRSLSRRSAGWIRNVIQHGIPAGGMPSFSQLPAPQIEALAAMVHSLNAPAAESAPPGDTAAGERYFFGEGRCSSCHMVNGRGSAAGPDLSDVANRLTLNQLRESLIQPSARIAAGYHFVTVTLRDGSVIRGFARSRTNFELVVQDLAGNFHLLMRDEISAVREQKGSSMPPVSASPEVIQNLVAYLSRRTGVAAGVAAAPVRNVSAGVSWEMILHPPKGAWLTYNGKLSGNRYSDLAQVNAGNVARLRLQWIFSPPLWKQFLPDTSYFRSKMQFFGVETTPLVAGGIMYATGPHETFALDARTGQQIWDYWRPRPPKLNVGDAALGTNRGVAVLGDKLFTVTQNAHLIALNRTTGRPVWDVLIPPKDGAHYGSTVAPLVVKNMVIAGISGGDWPDVRGFIAAYNASTGKLLWRFNVIPGAGDPAVQSWGGAVAPNAGGGATWVTGSYDPETDTLYWTTGNPYPDSNGRVRPGADLYTNCILALNPNNGKLKWYYQVTPHDVHDWDATAPVILADATYQRKPRKLLLFSNKNGFFYVLDRTTGRVLLAKPFVRVTWAKGIDANGRPELLPGHGIVCPADGTIWNAKAFDPSSGLYYVMALEKCSVKLSARSAKLPPEPSKKYVRAIDIHTGKIVWQAPQFGPGSDELRQEQDAGVLATAGGLLFYGDPDGNFVAADAQTGKTLWRFPANGNNKSSPMTYMVDGRQYIAVADGPNILSFSLGR